MKVRLLFFAGLRDLTGSSDYDAELPADVRDVAGVQRWLTTVFPLLRFDGVRFAVDEEFASMTTPVSAGQTIALIPPVSGG